MKKRYLIMLIIAIVLVLCIGAGFAFAYFFTDVFKSNKDLFLKYISQNTEIMDFVNDNDVKAYSDKQKQTPYTSEGTIKTNVTFPDSSQAQIANALQNCNISFNNKVDNANKYFNGTVKANYSDNQSIEFNLYRNNDVFAGKINDVLYKYIGLENNNLKEFAQKMNLPTEVISALSNKIEFNKIENSLNVFSDEDISALKNKYLKIITDNLTDDMFSKENSSDEIIYSVTLNETQSKTIIIALLNNLKDDEIIINKLKASFINNYNLTEETVNPYIDQFKQKIQDLIDSINSSTSTGTTGSGNFADALEQTLGSENTVQEPSQSNTESNLTIKVHSQQRQLVKTDFILGDVGSLVLSKSDDGVKVQIFQNNNEIISSYMQKIKSPTEIKYELVFSLNNNQIFDLTVGYAGLDTNSVNENSELSFDIDLGNSTITDAKTKIVTNYKATKTFDSIQKEEIQNSDILFLNTAPSRKSIETLYKNIETKFVELNRTKLQALGLTNEQNPFGYYIPSVIPVCANYVVLNPDKAPYFSIPAILTGTSVAILTGDNSILRKASNASNDLAISNVKEDVLVTANEALQNYYSAKYSKNSNTDQTPFSAVETALKKFKSKDVNIEYTYSNKIITLKNKKDSKTVTGTLSDNGEIKWN